MSEAKSEALTPAGRDATERRSRKRGGGMEERLPRSGLVQPLVNRLFCPDKAILKEFSGSFAPCLLSRFQGCTSEAEALVGEVQYRPGMFDCTVKRHHGMRTVRAGKDNKDLNKWPKSLQQTLNKRQFLMKMRTFRSQKMG
jgi:hypothetical protein